MSSVASFLKLSPQETLLDEWEVLDDSGFPDLGDFFFIVLSWLCCCFVGLIPLWIVISRPRRVGYLCLTNRRCLYVERGEGLFRNSLRVVATNLDDIVAVHSAYNETSFGVQSLTIVLYTRFEDTIRLGEGGRFLAKIPVLGVLFHRHSLGRDATKIPPVLFERVQQRRTMTAEGGSAY